MVSVVSPTEAFVVPKLGRQLGIAIPQAEVTEGRFELLATKRPKAATAGAMTSATVRDERIS